MDIKLNILGEDKRVCITPSNNSDKKLLEFVAEHTHAKVLVNKDSYMSSRSIEFIELKLFTEGIQKSFGEQFWDLLSDKQKISFWVKSQKSDEQIDIVSADELKVPTIEDIIQFFN